MLIIKAKKFADFVSSCINHNFYSPITSALGLYEVCDLEGVELNPYEKMIRSCLRKAQMRGRAFAKLILMKQEGRRKKIRNCKRHLTELQKVLNDPTKIEQRQQIMLEINYELEMLDRLNETNIWKLPEN